MTDQTPEARLAAALLAALKDTGYLLTHEYADSGVIDVGDAMVRADPTLAADLALAAAVRGLPDDVTKTIAIERRGELYRAAVYPGTGPATGWGDLTAAIEEAMRDD